MATERTRRERPLSPHLQVYRWGWTMSLSITHRLTGVVLSVGLVLVVAWLYALNAGAGAYETARALMGHWLARLVLGAWSLAFFYHLCNGIRHLLWDAGWGFELDVARRTGLLVVAASIVLAVLSWILAAGVIGGPR